MYQSSRFLKSETFTKKVFRIVFALNFVAFVQFAVGQTASETVTLELGKAVEREISGEQKHDYEVVLAADQYLTFALTERGTQVVIVITAPDGQKLMEVDASYDETVAQSMHLVAAAAGRYLLTIKPSAKTAPMGSYEIKATELRAATQTDRELAEAFRLNVEGRRLRYAGKYDEAAAAMEKSLAILERTPTRAIPADVLNELGLIYDDKNDFKKSAEFLGRAIAIYEKTHGPNHFFVASVLNNLAGVYRQMGDYESAETSYLRALMINEKKFGAEHVNVATLLNNIGYLYYTKGDYSKTDEPYRRALAIREKTNGAESFDVAIVLNNMAMVHRVRGDYPQAAAVLQRALEIAEKALSPEHPSVATIAFNLASVNLELGDYEKTERLFARVLAIREKSLGAEHLDVANSLNNIGGLYESKGEYERAESFYRRALTIREKLLGAENPLVGVSLGNLGSVQRARGEYEKAEALLRRALEIIEKKLGMEHSSAAAILNNFGQLYLEQGNYVAAEKFFRRALTTFEKANGAEHPLTARPLANLATVAAARGDFAQALDFQGKYLAIRERNLDLNLYTGSERQKLAYVETLTRDLASTVSLHSRSLPKSEEAKRMALQLILNRKGRALDAMGGTVSALRRRALLDDQKLIDQVSDVRTQLAALTLRGAGNEKPEQYAERLKALEERREKLEDQMSRRSAEFRVRSQTAKLDAIRALIPENAALVEFIAYRPADFKAPSKNESASPTHYAAYVLRRQGAIEWCDLGDAQPIHLAIAEFRQALRDPKRKDAKSLARAVDEKIMQPVRALLGETKQLLVSPDGDLNLIPFEALVDEQNRHLIENYSFTYLTSGRDLLRMQTAQANNNKPLVVADPTFGEPGETVAANTKSKTPRRQRRSVTAARDLSETYFTPLGGTAEEARSIRAQFPEAAFLTKDQATETALKQTVAPRILHVATHGFFLEDASAAKSAIRSSSAVGKVENPLVRSGLALAGANRRDGAADDGILTALEASGLNLWGTKLVVLSACDTGVGEVKNGEGVYGLRRAFVLAGTESLVMSLWAVSDSETRRLMTDYYKNLKQGLGRGAALRQAQLEMLKKENFRHPFYWAAFIQSGEWANLAGER